MKGFKFNKANLDQLCPAEKEYFAWSQDLPGFGIRISPSGRRSWLVQFRDVAGNTCRRTIGDTRVVPHRIAESRAQELLAHAKVHKVDLVSEERAAARALLERRKSIIGAVIAAYLSEPEVRSKRSFGEIRRYLEVVWRDVHGLDAEKVTRHELIPLLRRIAAERGGVTANRARATLSGCLTWGIRHGVLRRDSNPCAFLPSWDEKPRERALTLEELAAVWTAAPQVNETFGRTVRLLVLTGCRRSEIADLSWGEVDLGRAVIELPGSRTKNKLPHVVPLAPAAATVLASTPPLGSKVFVNFAGWSWAKSRLDNLLKLPAWTVHDIRRSTSTGLREHLGADPHLVELCLNHVSGSRSGVAGTYDRSQRLAERRALLERWADLITGAVGEAAPPPVNVVGIRR